MISVSKINIEGTGPADNLSATLGPVGGVLVAWTHIFILQKVENRKIESDCCTDLFIPKISV